ncbi:MAG: Pyrroline-5-carboxylate reductase [Acidobacteriaceae bacterium]|jgi:pyrroline-5-carboxylate reductase|nr:Pyrroline-5-carboxylate reductase [Acidobacteriaceae bacterium]
MGLDFSGKQVAVLGAGKMGGILLKALLDKKLLSPQLTRATVQHEERARALSDKLGIPVGIDNLAAVQNADIIFICVKPQVVREVMEQIRPHVTKHQLFISVAASVSTAQIEKALSIETAVVRAMPNTPCVLGVGMTALCKGKFVSKSQVETACALFEVVGRTVVVDEKHMDAVTGLSASGPAYIYIILESLAEAGVKVGLPRDIATLLAAQTTLGAATVVLETGDHPALLKDAVTTPAGCTIDGIMELEEGKLRVTLIKAVVKAAQRAKELANG